MSNGFTWGGFLALLWGGLVLSSAINYNLPASWWFEPQRPVVYSAYVGDCPAMSFDREINRPFNAEWTVTIMQRQESGHWATHMTFNGENDYRPENSLPDEFDLCWWTWQDTLNLVPGEYRVHTLWSIIPSSGPAKPIRRKTEPFTITERPTKEN